MGFFRFDHNHRVTLRTSWLQAWLWQHWSVGPEGVCSLNGPFYLYGLKLPVKLLQNVVWQGKLLLYMFSSLTKKFHETRRDTHMIAYSPVKNVSIIWLGKQQYHGRE